MQMLESPDDSNILPTGNTVSRSTKEVREGRTLREIEEYVLLDKDN